MLCHVLAEEGDHLWLAFRKPVKEANGARIATYYVVCCGDEAILVDPGGTGDFGPMLNAVTEKIDLSKISGIVITQAGAHTCGSIGLWAEVLGFDTPIYAAEVVAPELLHIDPELNIQPVPEKGGEVAFGDGSSLHLLAAPYLPTAASLTIYDPMTRVLYTSDIGTAEGNWAEDDTLFCEKFSLVGHAMNAFHQSWFASGTARDDWMEQVQALAIDVVAPRSGPCFRDKNVLHFMKWLSSLDIGVLVQRSEDSYSRKTDVAQDAPQETMAAFGKSVSDQDIESDEDIYKRLTSENPSMVPEVSDDGPPPISVATYDRPDSDPVKEHSEIEADDSAEDDAEEVSRLVDAIADEYDDDDDEEFDIVYVDEDGNEIDPSEIEDEELIEEEEAIEGNDEIRLDFPPGKMFRLITRSDFDGLVCAVLLEELDLINDILFVHPNQMQEGEIEVSEDDISTNLPYTPGIFASFDHHLSEITRLGKHYDNHIIDPLAPSAARVVYNYFGGKKRFPDISVDMMDAVDKGDAAQFVKEEVIDAEGWPLLNFIMDSRTGLGRYRGFRVPNYELMMSLIDYCRRYDIDDILEHPDVKERVDLYREHEELAKEQIKRCTTVHGNLAVLDLREEEQIYVVNRFMVYALFPDCNISMHVLWGRAQQNTVFAVGKSIFNKTSNTNIGELMLTYGGGGHRNAGTCQSDNALADVVRDAIIQRINADG